MWQDAFKEDDYQEVMAAVKYLVQNRKSMPTIADVKERMPKEEHPEDEWHKRFGYSNETIYYDDDFLSTVIWADVPKDIRDRMQFHCNPKDYAKYNATAQKVIDLTGNTSVKFYTDADTEFLKGKLTTWKNELSTQVQ